MWWGGKEADVASNVSEVLPVCVYGRGGID